MVVMHETFPDDRLQHGEQMVPIAVDVEDDYRLLVQVELTPGGDFHGLVKRAQPAGEYHERIALGIHHLLALMHGVYHMQFGDALMANLDLVEKFRNDASDMAAGIDGSVGDPSHQSAASSAIDDPHSIAGDQPAKVICSLGIDRVAAGCRA